MTSAAGPDNSASVIDDALVAAATTALRSSADHPVVLGLCGAQGSGKSTRAAAVIERLRASGVNAVALSLDDLYLPREQRLALTRIHPLLRTRGVPGTHDVRLGIELLDQFGARGRVAMPAFDKALDDRMPADQWSVAATPVDIVIFEGWCVGAHPQAETDLRQPINALEREQDGDGRWRRWVNAQLARDYQALFARIDILALLAAPSFSVVAAWRREQEHDLRRRLERLGEPVSRSMTDAEIDEFVQHYQRLTEHILREAPGRADLVFRLDDRRRLLATERAPPQAHRPLPRAAP
jgi:D-glycerate 3-kinase